MSDNDDIAGLPSADTQATQPDADPQSSRGREPSDLVPVTIEARGPERKPQGILVRTSDRPRSYDSDPGDLNEGTNLRTRVALDDDQTLKDFRSKKDDDKKARRVVKFPEAAGATLPVSMLILLFFGFFRCFDDSIFFIFDVLQIRCYFFVVLIYVVLIFDVMRYTQCYNHRTYG